MLFYFIPRSFYFSVSELLKKNRINDKKTFRPISFLFNFMSDAGVWAYN